MKKFLRVLTFFLIAAVALSVVFFPKPKEADAVRRRVIRIWNVDTFEGGRGSRTAFLRRAAREAEREREGLYCLVTSYTAEGAKQAAEEGELPDVLSFGIGLWEFAESSLSLPYSFAGGEIGGECLAYPWCRGGYALFSLTNSFAEEGRTAISCGGENLPSVCAALEGIEGEETEPIAAYTGFLSGKYRYLLGTQRDLCRFRTRGVEVYARPLGQYCDLYQYVSVLSAERRADCEAFLSALFSEEMQSALTEIGMYPCGKGEKGVFADSPAFAASVFTSREGLDGLKNAAAEKNVNLIEKYLKKV